MIVRKIFLIWILLACMEIQAVEPKNIVIFGAGYVGLVTGSCLAKQGHKVTFIDTNAEKIAFLQDGKIPFFEPGLEELFCQGIDDGLIVLKTVLNQELMEADIVFIAVNTPTSETGEPQLQAVQSVLSQIVSLKNSHHLVVAMRSTVLPDAFQALQKYCEDANISLVMNPEFLRESSAVNDFFHPPFCVAGGRDPHAVKAVLDFYEEITPKRYAVSAQTASLLKYACNAFHATKIAFTNEISSICESCEIDPVEMMEIFVQDARLNASAAYLKPGFSFGGPCLSKDLKALLSFGKSLPLLNAILPSNQCRFQKAVDTILKGNHRQLAIVGMSFKKQSDDVRDSPFVELIEVLHRNSISLKIYDPDIDFVKLKATNRELFDQRLSHLQPMVHEDVDTTFIECDGVVLCKDLLDASQIQQIKDRGIPLAL
ncbi:MAG: nucleotide sugar dehydrogenase [Parachlamydiaceae bacterium]